jgi:hypothetical protein
MGVTKEEPLTIMRLEIILKQHIFGLVSIVFDILRNGIMDFLIKEDDSHQRFQDLEDMI